jgi:hypothetical protein
LGRAGRGKLLQLVRERVVAIEPRLNAIAARHRQIELDLVHAATTGTAARRGLVGQALHRGKHGLDTRRPVEKLAELPRGDRLLAWLTDGSTRFQYLKEGNVIGGAVHRGPLQGDAALRHRRLDRRQRRLFPEKPESAAERIVVSPHATAAVKEQVVKFPVPQRKILVFVDLARFIARERDTGIHQQVKQRASRGRIERGHSERQLFSALRVHQACNQGHRRCLVNHDASMPQRALQHGCVRHPPPAGEAG